MTIEDYLKNKMNIPISFKTIAVDKKILKLSKVRSRRKKTTELDAEITSLIKSIEYDLEHLDQAQTL